MLVHFGASAVIHTKMLPALLIIVSYTVSVNVNCGKGNAILVYSENTFDLTDLPEESWGYPGSHRLQFENYCSKTWMEKVLHEKQPQIKSD